MTDQPHETVVVQPAASAAGVATGAIDALKFQPMLLVIVLLNCMMIAGAAYYLSEQEKIRAKLTEFVIAKCIPQGGVQEPRP